ncbi:hypothetical protein KUCAC02_028515 [Chaenocephalus aceratus]|uniref:Uncharacterized protein n=1 Tax=Chaenocephalus aceratus TaxID=36190 RepID=A0ACB9X3Y7_CHAAC|nr:hypothetical protein KUCAC02_028515 [Chaenocephalus aceratus]
MATSKKASQKEVTDESLWRLFQSQDFLQMLENHSLFTQLLKDSEHGEEDTFVAAQKEIESKEIDHKETLSTEETVSTVMVHGVGSNNTSETEKEEEGTQVKTEEEFELSSEENPAGPDMSKDTNMPNTVEKITNLNMETDMDTTKDKGTQQGSPGSKSRVPKAEDLDEMMDIGTVEQGEQEAQMKEEQENHLMEEDCSHSPAIFNTGRDISSPATEVKGIKVVNLLIPRLDTVRENAADQPIRSSPSPPLVKVKDEPIDEDYDQALISSTANVKDEPNIAKVGHKPSDGSVMS